METKLGFWKTGLLRKGLTAIAVAATLAIGASQAQDIHISGGLGVHGGHGNGYGGGYRNGYPRRGARLDEYRAPRGHYDYQPGSVHYDRSYHPDYGHWTPLGGNHTHGHYDVVPHATPGHYDYHRGGSGYYGGHH